MKKSELIDTYYSLYEILDHNEMIAEAMKELCKSKSKKSEILNSLESLRLHHIENELIYLYEDISMTTLECYKHVWEQKRLLSGLDLIETIGEDYDD